MSPLLTNPYLNRTKKHKKRPPTAADLTELRQNPWAVALASPARMCSITAVRAPRALLTEWGLVHRPNSDKYWFLPTGLLGDDIIEPKSNDAEIADSSQAAGQRASSWQCLKLRTINSLSLLRRMEMRFSQFKTKPRKPSSPIMRLVPYRWKYPNGPITAHEASLLVWRRGMPDFVLEKMRVDVLKRLKNVSGAQYDKHERDGVWRCIEMDEVSETVLLQGLKRMGSFERVECGAILIMGSSQAGDGAVAGMYSLPDFIALPQTASKVPLFDLSRLLSDAERDELRRFDPRFQNMGLYFRPNDATTIDAFLALWKLQGLVRHG
ncbi:hypothetical protein EYZ11_002518 [Aspergillus tanneri]|uniref:Uncharacterized protein n=1 Tax=Aspergillus tanneri TaxID=1220188 RepID=A0A4S3JQR0_9EURO|nr:uncharacterized protein ATNIH1004_007358 [Aspergillus tanneri]KAA8645937.1 hypothetical protein ATNIH1004_007358 [Aspergillus tanneri]THC98016.1 hypothetical protein EYZ11_002518 [Aspergillus tanneri]